MERARTLITLNDSEGTFIRTESTVDNMNDNFIESGYTRVEDISGKRYLLTPKIILIAESLPSTTICRD